ncbi:MAG: hypothetical protein OXL97_07140 [Chloroflexota bacterium]|nr:hypothetical protein [Chloroflexota bacterium]MDE2886079.1 hypothetical protein [Chloroflexota bacterium]
MQRLPPADREQRQQRYEYSSIQAEILEGQEELVRMRSEFESVLASATDAVLTGAEAVKDSFAAYASDFLMEDCRLEWSPQSAPLGQTGQLFKFPAFQLALGGSDFSGPVRRGGPSDVSESQREFIDISFRMALAHVAASQHVTTLVMDAPESSLDAVFVGRAANVLSTFSRPEAGNCLIVTSNVVDGGLIPVLLRNSMGEADRDARVVDLLTVAVSTAAVRSLWDEYEAARDKLLGSVDPPRA